MVLGLPSHLLPRLLVSLLFAEAGESDDPIQFQGCGPGIAQRQHLRRAPCDLRAAWLGYAATSDMGWAVRLESLSVR